jgi:SAM-dependent methyltransferase
MRNIYNKHYQQEEYFGKPYPGLVEFFEGYPDRNYVLDLGCGQGRDALFLGRIGYTVKGVDLSDVGIDQLKHVAQEEGLSVEGIVADIYHYPITDECDMVLLDSIFHFYKRDLEKEEALLIRIVNEVKNGGVICNFMQKGVNREREFKRIIRETGITFEVLVDKYTQYTEYDSEFHMYILKKQVID